MQFFLKGLNKKTKKIFENRNLWNVNFLTVLHAQRWRNLWEEQKQIYSTLSFLFWIFSTPSINFSGRLGWNQISDVLGQCWLQKFHLPDTGACSKHFSQINMFDFFLWHTTNNILETTCEFKCNNIADEICELGCFTRKCVISWLLEERGQACNWSWQTNLQCTWHNYQIIKIIIERVLNNSI